MGAGAGSPSEPRPNALGAVLARTPSLRRPRGTGPEAQRGPHRGPSPPGGARRPRLRSAPARACAAREAPRARAGPGGLGHARPDPAVPVRAHLRIRTCAACFCLSSCAQAWSGAGLPGRPSVVTRVRRVWPFTHFTSVGPFRVELSVSPLPHRLSLLCRPSPSSRVEPSVSAPGGGGTPETASVGPAA